MNTWISLILFTLVMSLACAGTTSEADAQSYWNKFRAASLASDYPVLSQLIHFPLEVKGVSDNMPIEKYEKNNLNKIFPLLMSQTVMQHQGDGKFQHMEFRDIVKSTQKVTLAADETEFSVEQFNFRFN